MRVIRGILLAAGRGNRFGGDKLMQLLPDGQTIALAAAKTLIGVLPNAIAVCRPEQVLLRQQLLDAGFQVETCDQADQGMGFTLATAVAASGKKEDLLVVLADMPFVTTDTLGKLILALEAGATLVQPVYRQTPGNPVGVSYRFRSQLLKPSGDFGARELLKRYAEEVAYLVVDDPGVIQDIDRPGDLPDRES